jgi:hypothetical protein
MDPFRRRCIGELLLILVVVFWLWYILLIEERWRLTLSMVERLALTLGIAGPREEEVQSQAVVQEQDLNEEPVPRVESPEVEIFLTQPSSSRRRPREEQEQ